MLINCPYCGLRDLAEFAVHGEAVRRPHVEGDLDDADNRAAFADAIYLRDNPAGLHREYWQHAIGCLSWLLVQRDTRTHDVIQVAALRSGEQAS